MSMLPAEGSGYDKVLSWAQLFVERLHSFEAAIEGFAGDSYLAAQLAYGYCVVLLEVRPCPRGPPGYCTRTYWRRDSWVARMPLR